MIEFYDRTFFWLFIMEIPHVYGRELLSAIKIKLGSLYPGDISECNIQVRKNGAKKDGYLVFVLDKNTGSKALPVSPLFIRHLYAKKDADVLYADKKWLDFVRIENGAVRSSTVKARNENTSAQDVKELCAGAENITVYCDDGDRELLSAAGENVIFIDKNGVPKKTAVHKISLFGEKSPAVKRRRFLTAVAAVFLVVLSSKLFYGHRQAENERNARARLEQELEREAALELRKRDGKLEELKKRYDDIVSGKKATPFDISSVISECSEARTRINAATFNGNFFQIEGVTAGSLGLLRNFENHYMVENARLHQVYPSGNGDAFTLSGNVRVKTAPLDGGLPAAEQIAVLEGLIAAETNYSRTDAHQSPSAFGAAVNALFKKRGCAVNGYRFTDESGKTELEMSLTGSGDAFFAALYEIKTKYRLWDVHLTRIRNLYPKDMLDVVVRIKTEFADTGTETRAAAAESDAPYPVAAISGNYFSRAARPEGRAKTAEPPPVTHAVAAGAERVSWLEYIGSVSEEDAGRFVYVKDTRTGEIMKLGQHTEGDMRYAHAPSGGIIAYINENLYEIKRR